MRHRMRWLERMAARTRNAWGPRPDLLAPTELQLPGCSSSSFELRSSSYALHKPGAGGLQVLAAILMLRPVAAAQQREHFAILPRILASTS